MELVTMKSCAWKEFHGINEVVFDFKIFKKMLMWHFCDRYAMNGPRPNGKYPGCILFSGAYNTPKTEGLPNGVGEIRKKARMLDRLEDIMSFIEDEGMGDIVEMPEFANSNHKTIIVPFMWIIDRKRFTKTLRTWLNDGFVPDLHKGNTAIWEI